jgi:hypothetical protein
MILGFPTGAGEAIEEILFHGRLCDGKLTPLQKTLAGWLGCSQNSPATRSRMTDGRQIDG